MAIKTEYEGLPLLKYLEKRRNSFFYSDIRVKVLRLDTFCLTLEDFCHIKTESFEEFWTAALREEYPSLIFDAFSLDPSYGYNIDGLTRVSGAVYKILESKNGLH